MRFVILTLVLCLFLGGTFQAEAENNSADRFVDKIKTCLDSPSLGPCHFIIEQIEIGTALERDYVLALALAGRDCTITGGLCAKAGSLTISLTGSHPTSKELGVIMHMCLNEESYADCSVLSEIYLSSHSVSKADNPLETFPKFGFVALFGWGNSDALDAAIKKCSQGSGLFCYKVGLAKFLGKTAEANQIEALQYFEKSCDLKNKNGCMLKGQLTAYLKIEGTHLKMSKCYREMADALRRNEDDLPDCLSRYFNQR